MKLSRKPSPTVSPSLLARALLQKCLLFQKSASYSKSSPLRIISSAPSG